MFKELIDREPNNMEHRFVYADWLEEHGQKDKANLWRWFAKCKIMICKSGHQWYTRQYDNFPGVEFEAYVNSFPELRSSPFILIQNEVKGMLEWIKQNILD